MDKKYSLEQHQFVSICVKKFRIRNLLNKIVGKEGISELLRKEVRYAYYMGFEARLFKLSIVGNVA
jgi:hypothetical protein